jgi:hypothetical protein
MRRILTLLALLTWSAGMANAADDSAKAAATRKKLDTKITVEYKDTLLRDVIDDLGEKTSKQLSFMPDTKNGVNLNTKVTFKGEDVTIADVLSAICDKYEMGYFVISQQNNGYDGSVKITRGKERGYAAGQEPKDKPKTDDKAKPDDKPKDKPKTDDKPKDKPKTEDKPEAKDKPKTDDKPSDDDTERAAGLKLRSARGLADDGKTEKAIEVCEDILKKFPNTKAAEEAKALLEKLNK